MHLLDQMHKQTRSLDCPEGIILKTLPACRQDMTVEDITGIAKLNPVNKVLIEK